MEGKSGRPGREKERERDTERQGEGRDGASERQPKIGSGSGGTPSVQCAMNEARAPSRVRRERERDEYLLRQQRLRHRPRANNSVPLSSAAERRVEIAAHAQEEGEWTVKRAES